MIIMKNKTTSLPEVIPVSYLQRFIQANNVRVTELG